MTPDELIAEYAAQAKRGQFRGLSVLQYSKSIKKLVDRTQAKTLLDFGSGRGEPWVHLAPRWGIKVKKYDPAIPQFAEKPVGRFDGVVCADVLEHLPADQSEAVIDELFAYAVRFVFASTCSRPSKKLFPNGENMHITLRPFSEWKAMFERASAKSPVVEWILKDTP